MKILHLLQSNRFSGAENVVCQIINMFRNDPGVDMLYASKDGQIRQALAERGIAYAPLRELSVQEVRRVIDEYKPDLIHAHDRTASFLAARCCGKTPVVCHIHNNFSDSGAFSLKSVAFLWAGLKARHIFWVSKSSYEGYAYKKLLAKKSEVLYNVIDVDALYEKMSADTRQYHYDVAYVGRLTYPKNPQRLMRVLRKAADKLPGLKAAVIGTGDLEEETRVLCKELGLENNVDFLGFQSNPLKLLHDARLMLMTSRFEGTPMCALEAMALGVPIVSTPTDGLCELVEEGKNGYLSDGDDALAHRVVEIITDHDLHAALSEYTLNKAKRINEISVYKNAIERAYKNDN